ncbi:hypothetical protein CAMGR0001_1192 [Campylobacter gracilis RM3268]|uniref:Uncharacterized protein n=1 Tax=Campylobacter gracilis RM3268 TaxID=553220 RepID=C8PIZ3_9BACT|nr:hypothetical protein CAMGR0001_1192 [Campylobacter gracilis RM3268]
MHRPSKFYSFAAIWHIFVKFSPPQAHLARLKFQSVRELNFSLRHAPSSAIKI